MKSDGRDISLTRGNQGADALSRMWAIIAHPEKEVRCPYTLEPLRDCNLRASGEDLCPFSLEACVYPGGNVN